MLAREPAEKLIQLLSNRVDTIKHIHELFQAYFPLNSRFSVTSSIALMLLDHILDHYQQITSIYLLFAEFPDKISENPFLNVFLKLNDERLNSLQLFPPVLNRILPLVIAGVPLSFLDPFTIPQILSEQFQLPTVSLISYAKPNIEIEHVPALICVPDSDSQSLSQMTDEYEHMSHEDFLLEYLTCDGFSDQFEESVIRPIPAISPIFNSEIQQILISSPAPPPFLFDISAEAKFKQEAAQLFKLAMTKKLTEAQTQIVLNYGITDSLHFKESDLSGLIENNSKIATAVALKIYEKKPKISDYLSELPINVRNVEVVQGFALSLKDKEAARQFIHKFAIAAINSINYQSDNSIYSTKSRLLCTFLVYIRNNNIEFSPELKIELQSFCMELGKKGITEAQDLISIL